MIANNGICGIGRNPFTKNVRINNILDFLEYKIKNLDLSEDIKTYLYNCINFIQKTVNLTTSVKIINEELDIVFEFDIKNKNLDIRTIVKITVHGEIIDMS